MPKEFPAAIVDALAAHPLFDGVFADPAVLTALLPGNGCVSADFAPGEVILHPGRWIGLILSGGVRVYSADRGRQVLLRSMSAGDMIGVAQFFSQSEAPMSRIVAHRETRLLILESDAVGQLLNGSPRFRDNCLAFLADRIAFLNRKIATFTGGSAERRLAHYLNHMAGDADCFLCTTSLSAMADALDISRASLYRALQTLEQDGFLHRDSKRFCLQNRSDLLTRYQ